MCGRALFFLSSSGEAPVLGMVGLRGFAGATLRKNSGGGLPVVWVSAGREEATWQEFGGGPGALRVHRWLPGVLQTRKWLVRPRGEWDELVWEGMLAIGPGADFLGADWFESFGFCFSFADEKGC